MATTGIPFLGTNILAVSIGSWGSEGVNSGQTCLSRLAISILEPR